MVSMHQIRAMGRDLGRRFQPERVLLFGSHARGDAHKDSDVDLLVITSPAEASVRNAVAMRLSLTSSIPIDILVRSQEQIQERLEMGDFFMRRILEEGVLLYEKSDA